MHLLPSSRKRHHVALQLISSAVLFLTKTVLEEVQKQRKQLPTLACPSTCCFFVLQPAPAIPTGRLFAFKCINCQLFLDACLTLKQNHEHEGPP